MPENEIRESSKPNFQFLLKKMINTRFSKNYFVNLKQGNSYTGEGALLLVQLSINFLISCFGKLNFSFIVAIKCSLLKFIANIVIPSAEGLQAGH